MTYEVLHQPFGVSSTKKKGHLKKGGGEVVTFCIIEYIFII
jgi:hypothetical protein